MNGGVSLSELPGASTPPANIVFKRKNPQETADDANGLGWLNCLLKKASSFLRTRESMTSAV